MKLPPLNALRVFLVAAEHHSFTKAGETLHLTQGAVSRHIQTLEAHYGLPLFVRQARGLTLTPEGVALFPAVRDAFSRIEAASDAISRRSRELRVKASPSIASRWVLPRFTQFRNRYPELMVSLVTVTGFDPNFKSREYDISFQACETQEPGLIYHRLRGARFVPVASPDLFRDKPLPSIKQFLDYPLLHPSHEDQFWSQWFALAGMNPGNSIEAYAFDTLDLAITAAARGMGITLAEESMIADDLANGSLIQLSDIALVTSWAYYLIYPQELATLPSVIAFRDWALAEFSDAPPAGSSDAAAG
ncbi:LysR substrate-binding domain-containing protein [Vogesella urethralis]|jgi:LysR family glycine cleavage system transcriptional activator|uniref:LysR substrate-binding domain-containing protein n=1 Tax=Vogesella urethralis TaxID=2592656 RepID=UPI0014795153|nr:LysR substrate-binding domain-containing protein [Vogesella urethralis]MEC5205447.1 LysR family glycine cleavage system transcriptional activator [Vogesella perlucida]